VKPSGWCYFLIQGKGTAEVVEMCHCEIDAMLPTKGSGISGQRRHVHIKGYGIVSEWNVLF